jgi:hypothetical protein
MREMRKRKKGWKGIEIKERQREEKKIRKINNRLTNPRMVSVMISIQ